jgi:glycosyltransferase involved in cell wall biosynthesis
MEIAEQMKKLKAVVVVPTYNNAMLLPGVLDALLANDVAIIVVNDGSTDATSSVLSNYTNSMTILSYPNNKGKGHALWLAFEKALSMGYDYALTMDSDGQHKVDSIGPMLEEEAKSRNAIVVGTRPLAQENKSGGSIFANGFSNFWFRLQTGIAFPDTQSGLRIYTLQMMKGMKLHTSRYEAELEILVRCAWRGIAIKAVPVDIYYPPREKRVSHFRPFIDFARISALNTVLTFLAIVYYIPKRWLKRR